MEIIKCPCCGGQTKNIINCDYCGSYLVQLAQKGPNIDLGTLGPTATRLAELQTQLENNLKDQISAQGSNNHIHTIVKCEDDEILICNPISLTEIFYELRCFSIPKIPIEVGEIGLILAINIIEYSRAGKFIHGAEDVNTRMLQDKLKLEWFKNTSAFQLLKHVSAPLISTTSGFIGTRHTYFLNFGLDYKGASVAVSQLLFGTNHIAADDPNITYLNTTITEAQEIQRYKDIKKKINNVKMLFTILSVVYAWFLFSVVGVSIQFAMEEGGLFYTLGLFFPIIIFIYIVITLTIYRIKY